MSRQEDELSKMRTIKPQCISPKKLSMHLYKETRLYGFLNSALVGESSPVARNIAFTPQVLAREESDLRVMVCLSSESPGLQTRSLLEVLSTLSTCVN